MIDHSKGTIIAMAALNNAIVAAINDSKVSPCEAVVVLTLLRSQMIAAFEVRAMREDT
jgi:hypothetical protein